MKNLLKTSAIGLCLLAVASCSTSGAGNLNPIGQSSKKFNAKLGVVPAESGTEGLDPIAKAAFWGTRYDREPNNVEAAVNFSKALRGMGSNGESLEVISRASRTAPDNPAVQLEMGKSLIANERSFEAVRPIEKAIANSRSKDWRMYSAYGVALDKIGEHKEARKQYDLALSMNPRAYEVYNNKGLSYALSGNLDLAERTLRAAATNTRGTAKVRQNLALVLGFKGKTAEAERLARSDLPPVIADNNVAYYQSLVSKPAYWRAASNDNVELPTFEAPAAPTFETVPFVDEPATTPAEETPAPLPQEIQPLPEPEPQAPAEDPSVLTWSETPAPGEALAPLAQPEISPLSPNELATISPSGATGAPVQLETTNFEDAEKAPEEEAEDAVEDDETGA